MALVLVIAVPVLGVMYMDMWNATNAAVFEVKKMKELRRQIQEERLDADRKPTEGNDSAQ